MRTGRAVRAHPPLAHKDDLLAEVAGTAGELGVTGEARIIKATYLTVVSKVLAEPVSLVVKGSSAEGSRTPRAPRCSSSRWTNVVRIARISTR